jgi:uncharacterized protein (DUF3084 family)
LLKKKLKDKDAKLTEKDAELQQKLRELEIKNKIISERDDAVKSITEQLARLSQQNVDSEANKQDVKIDIEVTIFFCL